MISKETYDKIQEYMYGNNIRVYFFFMVLSYSRMKFAYFSTEPFNAEKTVEAHKYAFKYFGGRPQMLVYDQDKIYTDEQIHIGMEHCNIVNICTVMELSAYLLYRYGEETARKFLNHRTYKTYLKRANEIKEEEIHGRN